jgi:SDR family mycofactocin-dependent oxidoreductase
MGILEGKVAFITGAARGQGRSHALCMAQEGADIIALDICAQVSTVAYAMATPADLQETVSQVEAVGRRVVAVRADVRDHAALSAGLSEGVNKLGRLDIVVANAGIASFAPVEAMTTDVWNDMISTNLSGAFETARAAIPHLKAHGEGGAMVFVNSTAGLKGAANLAHYTAAKHGMVGLMKVLAIELAPFSIRVNSVHPTTVATEMSLNQQTLDLFRPDLAPGTATRDDASEGFRTLNLMPVPWVEPLDVSNAVVWLCSDAARFITGVQLPVDAGSVVK